MTRWKCRDCGDRPLFEGNASVGATTDCPFCGGECVALGRGIGLDLDTVEGTDA